MIKSIISVVFVAGRFIIILWFRSLPVKNMSGHSGAGLIKNLL
jgi:hypothetical protein